LTNLIQNTTLVWTTQW